LLITTQSRRYYPKVSNGVKQQPISNNVPIAHRRVSWLIY
jgi:hypothetical protein